MLARSHGDLSHTNSSTSSKGCLITMEWNFKPSSLGGDLCRQTPIHRYISGKLDSEYHLLLLGITASTVLSDTSDYEINPHIRSEERRVGKEC